MNKDNKNTEETTEEGAKSFTLLYIAIGCFAAACILFALSLILPLVNVAGAGVYMLIASMITSLAAVSFINGQKRRATNKLCKIIQILSYAVMIAAVAVFVIGTATVNASK